MRHKFYKQIKSIVNQSSELLIQGDHCAYCNLIITKEIRKSIFDYNTDNKYSLYFDNFLIRAYNEINEQYNCISDEEYLIKKMLE
jgi:hypothetical protein